MDLKEILAKLNDRQQQFSKEYLVDFNATQAAIRAGYSEKTAGSQGFDLLKKPEIQSYLGLLMEERSKRTQVTADRVVHEIAKIAFHNIGDLMDYFDGNVLFEDLDSMKFPEIIKTIKIKEVKGAKGERLGKIAEIVVHDKLKALELLGRHTAAFTENVNLTSGGKPLEAPKQTVNVYINHRAKGQPLGS